MCTWLILLFPHPATQPFSNGVSQTIFCWPHEQGKHHTPKLGYFPDNVTQHVMPHITKLETNHFSLTGGVVIGSVWVKSDGIQW